MIKKLTQTETAQAYCNTYHLLGQLYLEAITPTLTPKLQKIPTLSALLPNPFDSDQAAVAHYQLFHLNLFPYEAIFLDVDGLLGGQITNSVTYTYQQNHYTITDHSSSPDHLGHELQFLAFLCGQEAKAWQAGQTAVAQQHQSQQYHFLHNHLLRWLYPCLAAIQQQRYPFYSVLAQLTYELVGTHLQTLIGTQATKPPALLPPPPDLLADEKTGLKEIAHALITPLWSGLFLSRDAITTLAHAVNLPRGFGNRQQMLTNLLRAATQYNSWPRLLTQLDELLSQWHIHYHEQAAASPATIPFVTLWQQRLTHTQTLLKQIELSITAMPS